MRNFSIIITLAVVLFSCNQSEKGTNYESFGASISDEDVTSLQALETGLSEADSVQIKVTATVEEVCQMKGCWMTLQTGEGKPVRVTFKDYGYFVPKDIAGREVIISGVASETTLSEETARHYAEDAGTEFDSTKTYTEIAFVADGVLLSPVQE